MFTIYHRPLDMPDVPYVVRAFVITAAGPLPETEVLVADTLVQARALIPWEADTRIGPSGDDGTSIVETWV